MFNNQKIRSRILLGYSVPLIMFILVAIAVYSSLVTYKKVHESTARGYLIVSIANKIAFDVVKKQRTARGYLLMKNNMSRNEYNEAKNDLEKSIQDIGPLVKDEKQKELLGSLVEKTKQINEFTDKEFILADKEGQNKAIELFRRGESIKLAKSIDDIISEFEKKEAGFLDVWKMTEEGALRNIGLYLMSGIFLAFSLSVIIGLLIANSINKAIAGAVNAMSTTSTEIAATVVQHERTASQQASMVNETTTTVQELGVSSRQSSEQAATAAEVAQEALKATGEGTIIVNHAIESINSLGAKVGMVADQILKLGEQTAQIGNLANIVKDLSSEINMLALNAAVEAARAGEHGKGFAVVAGEVRKLANESKKSAEQANAVIADIQKATNATILKTEEGTQMVAEVTGYSRSVGELFDSLTAASNKVYENAQQAMLNARQQATALGQVVEAMNVLNTGARDTAAGINQTKAGIEQLNSAAVNLKQML